MPSFNGWFPQISPDATYVASGYPGVLVGTLQLSSNQRDFTSTAIKKVGNDRGFQPVWRDNDSIVYGANDKSSIHQSDAPFTSTAAVAGSIAHQELAAGGGVWAAWSQALDGVRTSAGTFYAGARGPALDPAGRLMLWYGWRTTNSNLKLASGQQIASGNIVRGPSLGTQGAAWTQVVGGRQQVMGWRNSGQPVNLSINTGVAEFSPVVIDTPSGPYILSQTSTQLLLRAWGSRQPHVVTTGSAISNPHGVFNSTYGFVIAWAVLGQLHIVRIPTAVPTPQPEPPPPPPPSGPIRVIQGDFLTMPGAEYPDFPPAFYPGYSSSRRTTIRNNTKARKYTHIAINARVPSEDAGAANADFYDHLANPNAAKPFYDEIINAGLKVMAVIGFEDDNDGEDLYPVNDAGLGAAITRFVNALDSRIDLYMLGVEVSEYWTPSQITSIGKHLRARTTKPIYVHFNSDKWAPTGISNQLQWWKDNPWATGLAFQYGFGLTTGQVAARTAEIAPQLRNLNPRRFFIASEYAVDFGSFNDTEADAIALGNAAMNAGADGFMNGGTAIVASPPTLPVLVPPIGRSLHIGYFKIAGRDGDHVLRATNGYGNCGVVEANSNDFSDTQNPTSGGLKAARDLASIGAKIIIAVGVEAIERAEEYWDDVLAIFVASENLGTVTANLNNITTKINAAEAKRISLGLGVKPYLAYFTGSQIDSGSFFVPSGVTWVGVEGYFTYPTTPAQAKTKIDQRMAKLTGLGSSHPRMLIAQAYDRSQAGWIANPAAIAALQPVFANVARQYSIVNGILWFSYARKGGTLDYASYLRPWHYAIYNATIPAPPQPPPPPPGPPTPPTPTPPGPTPPGPPPPTPSPPPTPDVDPGVDIAVRTLLRPRKGADSRAYPHVNELPAGPVRDTTRILYDRYHDVESKRAETEAELRETIEDLESRVITLNTELLQVRTELESQEEE